MTRSKHPAVLKFPAKADRISELMRSNEEFAGICRDYAQIVGDITRKERTPGHSSVVLTELLRLRSDLESDIFDMLSEAEVNPAASELDSPILLNTTRTPRGKI